MSKRNYELTDETIDYNGTILHRIRTIVDLPQYGVKAGDLGGFVESYDNLRGNAWVCDNAKVFGCAQVFGNAVVVASDEDYIVFKNWWSSGRYFTWTRSNNMWSVGCFYGTGEELIDKAYKDSEKSGRQYKRVVDYVNEILKEE